MQQKVKYPSRRKINNSELREIYGDDIVFSFNIDKKYRRRRLQDKWNLKNLDLKQQKNLKKM